MLELSDKIDKGLLHTRIQNLSSITILFGRTSSEYFAYIPDFRASCHLIHPENETYNKEKLISLLNTIDGITFGRALYLMADKLEN